MTLNIVTNKTVYKIACLLLGKDSILSQHQEIHMLYKPMKQNPEYFSLHNILDVQLFDTWTGE